MLSLARPAIAVRVITHHEESPTMKQPAQDPHKNSGPARPPADQEAARHEQQKRQAESREVAGRHKNDGQKDHKGAR
jgi:hypothetical protein